MPETAIVAIDPGRNIGVAFVAEDRALEFHVVLNLARLAGLEFPPNTTVLVGNGTGSETVQNLLVERGVRFEVVDEWGSSLAARKLYFHDQPPRGWQRLLPQGMRTPPELIDDYAAYALALAYLAKKSAGPT